MGFVWCGVLDVVIVVCGVQIWKKVWTFKKVGLLLHKVVQSWIEISNMFLISFRVFDVKEMNAFDNQTLVFAWEILRTIIKI